MHADSSGSSSCIIERLAYNLYHCSGFSSVISQPEPKVTIYKSVRGGKKSCDLALALFVLDWLRSQLLLKEEGSGKKDIRALSNVKN